MQQFRCNRLTPILLLAAALAMRAVIPAGYMPADGGSGLWFEFCPEGVPAEFIEMLSGTGHAHHGDVDHDDHQCPVGHLLLSAAAFDDYWQPELAPTSFTVPATGVYRYSSVVRTHYQSRGPPA